MFHQHHPASPIRAAAPSGPDAGTRKPFWHRDSDKSLHQRIARIHRINDPTIKTDNVLRWVMRIIYLAIGITGLIGGMSYWKFFGLSIDNVYVVGVLTVAIAGILEFGKYYCTTQALRTAFFKGFGYIWSEVHTSVIWCGLLLVGALTLIMSAYNSTKGAEQLSYLIAHKSAEGQAVFTPQTAEIDAQIAAEQSAQTAAQNNRITTGKYKGMVDWQSSKTAKTAGTNAAALIAQKDAIVATQRADWDRHQAERAKHNEHAAGFVMKVGGWLELLQLILMFVLVACEKQLASHPEAQPHPTGPISSSQFATNGQFHNYAGFKTGADGNYIAYQSPEARGDTPGFTVSQSQPAVSQLETSEPDLSVILPDEVLRWFESEIRKEPSHFDRKDANPDTVVSRIHNKLRRAHMTIDRMNRGAFSADAAKRFGMYLTGTVEPLLDFHKRPYAGMQDLVASLRHKTEGEAVIL